MGSCCSKKSTTSCTPTPQEVKIKPSHEQPEKMKNTASAIVDTPLEQEASKKEVFVVKHRKSHEIDRNPDQEKRKSVDKKKTPNSSPVIDVSPPAAAAGGATVRTSSCTKEEVDAILIQCGRLSRSSSGVKPAGGGSETPSRERRYSGSKRSFDFDMEMGSKNNDDDVAAVDDHHRRRRQPGESRVFSPSSRRRSRERDPQQQRSGSKERGTGNGNGGGRRVSRSPNRRSESPVPSSGAGAGGSCNRPGKMVSVPATDKSNNAVAGEVVAAGGGGVKRIQVKRNAGEAPATVGSRSAASPRSRSPARANLRVLNENQNQQPMSLSRSNSRKAEHSPYRRNPLAEIDTNAAGSDQPGNKVQIQKPNGDKMMNNKTNNLVITKNSLGKEHQVLDENPKPTTRKEHQVLDENPKPSQVITRTRSSRLSRDLDITPETLLNPNPNPPSYASLLLEDIQNFHQKHPTITTTTTTIATTPAAFSLPACVSKACSILEAVADLNSATSSTQFKKDNLVESEIVVNDDLMEPSLHKYVTVRRGTDADNEEQESSGSNSFAGSQQMSWISSSWEPNSADSNNCWSSSRSNARDDEVLKSGEYPRNGIGRGRVGRSAHSMPNNSTVDSM